MRTVRELLREAARVAEADVRAMPWKFGAAAYQAALGVHQPWIAEISPMQYAHMGKSQKAAYDKKRSAEWDASAAVKQEWRAAVAAAYQSGEFDPKDADVHPEAVAVAREADRAKADAEAKVVRAVKNRENAITDAKQVKVGDRVWLVIQRAYAEVLKVSTKSVVVKGAFGPYKVPVQERTPLLLWNDPREVGEAVTVLALMGEAVLERAEWL